MSQATSDGVPVQLGVAVGAAAWIVGIVLTFILGQAGISQVLSLIIGFLGFTGALVSYWAFHNWFIGSGATQAGGFALFTLVPIILLVISGYYVASKERLASSGDAFKTGASVAVGYFILAVLTIVYLMTMGGSGSGVQLNLDLAIGLLIAGVIFPVVFGGIGGAIADSM